MYGLFEDVTSRFPEMPVVLYDNPATTGFTFSDELRVSVAHLPSVVSIKLNTIPDGHDAASEYVEMLRGLVPEGVSIGISGDDVSAREMSARLDPIWALFAKYGSFRVTAALATLSGSLPTDAVYAPVRPLSGSEREEVAAALRAIDLLE